MKKEHWKSLVNFFVIVALMGFLGVNMREVQAEESMPLQGKKIAMILPYIRYDQTEFRIPQEIFEKAGMQVIVVSSQKGEATAPSGDKVQVDLLLDDLNVADFDAIVFIGGYGTEEYVKHQGAFAIAQEAVKQDKVLAAICWAPIILANAGVLKGKKATASCPSLY